MDNRRKNKRVIHPLTKTETQRLRKAREETEAAKEEILRKGRVYKRAWKNVRGGP